MGIAPIAIFSQTRATRYEAEKLPKQVSRLIKCI